MKDIKNWIIGGGFAVVWAITLGFLDWRASVHASNALKDAGIVPEAKITAMEDDIDDNSTDIHDIEVRWNNLVDALAANRAEP